MTAAELFLKYDYAETKDLLKTFITLISATLVLSLTFSEKIIGFDRPQCAARNSLFMAWTLFILSLICAGIGMTFIAAAAGQMLYDNIPFLNWSLASLALTSWTFVLIAGAAYVAGLIALALSAARAILASP